MRVGPPSPDEIRPPETGSSDATQKTGASSTRGAGFEQVMNDGVGQGRPVNASPSQGSQEIAQLRETLKTLDPKDPSSVAAATDRIVEWAIQHRLGPSFSNVASSPEFRRAITEQLLGDPQQSERIQRTLDAL